MTSARTRCNCAMGIGTDLTVKFAICAICVQIVCILAPTIVWWAASSTHHVIVNEIINGDYNQCFMTEGFPAGYNRFNVELNGDNTFDFIISTNETEVFNEKINRSSPYIQRIVSKFNRTSVSEHDNIWYWVHREFYVVICASRPLPVHVRGYVDVKNDMLATKYSNPLTIMLWIPIYVTIIVLSVYGVRRFRASRKHPGFVPLV